MIKKITTLFAVLAFASFSSAALACNTSCGDKDGKDNTEITTPASFEVANCGCGGGKDRDGD